MSGTKEVEITARHRPTEYVKAVLLAVVGLLVLLLFLSLLIAGVTQHPTSFLDYLVTVGHDWLLMIFLVMGAAILLAVGWVVWTITRGQYIMVEQMGGYWRRGVFRDRFHPLGPATVAAQLPAAPASQVTVTEELSIPRLGDLLRKGELVKVEDEQPLMLQGMRQDGTYRYGTWPGVIAIIGMQNVGKTVSMVTLIVIALLQGAKVVICDTHHTKARSLYKKVLPLHGLVTFATTEEEVLVETQKFSQELTNRKRGSQPYPYILFYDELCSLVRAQNEELRRILPTVMEKSSQEGHGYGLHLVAAIHDVSNKGIGDARLRGFWNWVYCHRMEAGQSKFIEAFKGWYGDQKTSMLIAGLPAGHVMVRNEVNEVEYLIMPYAESKDVLVASKIAKQSYQPMIQEPSQKRLIQQPADDGCIEPLYRNPR